MQTGPSRDCQTGRRILPQRWWSDKHEAEDIGSLLEIFECDDIEELENRLDGLLPEDPGDVNIDDDVDSLAIRTTGVSMWSLTDPVSVHKFDAYLFELSERVSLQTLLWELPDSASWEEDGAPSIVPALAELFRTYPR